MSDTFRPVVLKWEKCLTLFLVGAAAILLFARLDASYLLHVPFASHRPGEVWVFHPWVQFYLTAASFALFGVTTWAARAPFALWNRYAIPAGTHRGKESTPRDLSRRPPSS